MRPSFVPDDDMRPYFSRVENEPQARIEVLERRSALPYDAIARMRVADLPRYDITLFGRQLIVAAYHRGFRATWAPNCMEVEETFLPGDSAIRLLERAYVQALQARGFNVALPTEGAAYSRSASPGNMPIPPAE